MMSTWVSPDPLRHPWFNSATLKRKHSESSDDGHDSPPHPYHVREPDSDNDNSPLVYPTPSSENSTTGREDEELERKRRRCDTIERQMACMYIESQQNPWYPRPQVEQSAYYPPQLDMNGTPSYTYTMGDTIPFPQNPDFAQYAVEEPASYEVPRDDYTQLETPTPPIAEVRMKGAEPSWYEREKDRIVITDLDEAIEEAEEEYKSEAEPHPNASDYADSNADYSISSVLLEHIKKQANFPYSPVPSSAKKDAGGALIVYRPPPLDFFSNPGEKGDQKITESTNDGGPNVEEISIDTANTFSSPPGQFETGTVSVGDEPMDMDMDVEL